jgi:SAM-dependent methyltransferase
MSTPSAGISEAAIGNWLDWKLPAQRQYGLGEWMDQPGADEGLIDDSLAFLTRLNDRMGWSRATLDAMAGLAQAELARAEPARAEPARAEPSRAAPARAASAGRRLSIVDVGTGAGDLPRAIVHDARFAGARVVGVDLHQRTADYARRHSRAQFEVLQADALALPFADKSVDLCVSGLFLHHLPDELAVRALAEMRRVSRLGVVAGDLLRSLRGLAGIRLLGLMSNPMVRHDGEVSVRQAFTPAELRALFGRAGLGVRGLQTLGGIRVVVSAVDQGVAG